MWGHLITRYNKREDSFSETHPTTAMGFVDLTAAKMCLNHADVTNSLPTRLQTKSSLNQLVVVWLYGIMKFFSHKIVLEYFKKTICQMTKIEELIISSYRTTRLLVNWKNFSEPKSTILDLRKLVSLHLYP